LTIQENESILELDPSVKIDLSSCSQVTLKKDAFAALSEGAKNKSKVEKVIKQSQKKK